MTSMTQAPGATDQADATHLSLDAAVAHGDTLTQAVAESLASLIGEVPLELGPAEVQADLSDLAPAGGAHGVLVSLNGTVIQVAVVLDDVLRSTYAASNPVDDEGAPPAWLGAASNAVEGWARSQGSVVSGALPIERAAELDHLLTVDGGLTLVAAGLFHEGRHAGTVALVARAGAPAGSGPAAGTAGSPDTAASPDTTGSPDTARLTAPTIPAHDAEDADSAEPTRAAALRALADVEMLVTAELGRTRMNVADLLELGPGSVIELDRTAGSPIDLLVNGTLIARGEVVVIDEEYGIRLTEVVGSGDA